MPPTPNSSYHYVFVKNILRYWRCKVINVMLCHVVSCLFVAGLQNLWTAAVQRQAVALAFLISWPAFGLYFNPWGNADLTFKDIHGRNMFSGFDVAGLQFPLKGLLCRFHSVWRDTHNLPVDPIDASWMHHERALSKPNQSWHWCKRSMVIRILSSWLWLSCQSFKTKTISGYQQPTFLHLRAAVERPRLRLMSTTCFMVPAWNCALFVSVPGIGQGPAGRVCHEDINHIYIVSSTRGCLLQTTQKFVLHRSSCYHWDTQSRISSAHPSIPQRPGILSKVLDQNQPSLLPKVPRKKSQISAWARVCSRFSLSSSLSISFSLMSNSSRTL